MGWLEGLVSGYAGRRREIEAEETRKAELSAQREGRVMEMLLNSPDEELRGMAATGLLANTQPGKRKKGLQGWFGEMESNPIYPTIMQYLKTPQLKGYERKVTQLPSAQGTGISYAPTAVPNQNISGRITEMPGQQGSAALPATSPTTPGAPAQTPVEPEPPPRPEWQPIVPSTPPQMELEPPEMLRAMPEPTRFGAPGDYGLAAYDAPAPQPPSGFFQSGVAQPTAGPPPVPPSFGYKVDPGKTERGAPIYGLPRAFPTAADLASQEVWGRGTGEYEYLVEVGRRAGQANPEQWAAQLVASKAQGSVAPFLTPREVEYEDASGRTVRGFAVPNRLTGQMTLLDGSPLPPGARQARPTLGGVAYQQAALDLFGGIVPPGYEPMVIDHAQALTGGFAEERALGAGRGQIQTELDKPIGTLAAADLGVPPTTTLRQLQQTIPLNADQRARMWQVGQIEESVGVIDRLITQVFPEVEQGVMGRIYTSLSLAGQWVTGDPQIAELEAAIEGALAQIVRVNGDVGALSDGDIQRARAEMASLRPGLFRGDTRLTALARLQVVKRLLEKARTPRAGFRGAPPTTGAPGATAAPATTPGANVGTPPPAAGGPPTSGWWTDDRTGQIYLDGRPI